MTTSAWVFALVAGVAVVETVLSLRWNQAYFSSGIRVFRRELPLHASGPALPSAERMEERLRKSAFPSFRFHRFGDDSLAFRETAALFQFRFHYTPVMHGLIRFDRSGARVEVSGFLNWFTVVFTLAFVLLTASVREPLLLGFLAGLLALIYAIQVKRFGQVATIAREEWDD